MVKNANRYSRWSDGMESHLNSSQEISLLQPVGFCQYVTSDGFALHSPALASLNLSGEYQGCRIEKGDVTLTDSFRWVSPMMQFHNVLVFLGISPLGKSSLHFLYGEPWCYKRAWSGVCSSTIGRKLRYHAVRLRRLLSRNCRRSVIR